MKSLPVFKQFYYLLALSIFITSCSNNELSCSDGAVLDSLKEQFQSNFKSSNWNSNEDISEKYAMNFIVDHVAFEQMYKVNLDEKLEKCTCKAKLVFDLDKKFVDRQYDNNERNADDMSPQEIAYYGENPIKSFVVKGVDILYSVQALENGDFLASSEENNFINYLIYRYYIFENNPDASPISATLPVSTPMSATNNSNYDYEEVAEDYSYGYINGKNVIMRSSPNTQGKQLHVFKTYGENITIMDYTTSNSSNGALLAQDIFVTINGRSVKFIKGKAVTIKNTSGDYSNVIFIDDKGNRQEMTISSDMLESANNDYWYKIKAKNGIVGYVYGKFIASN